LRPVLTYVETLLAGAEYCFEQRVTFPAITGAFGTADLIVRIGSTVHVIDFKFGALPVLALYSDGDEDRLNWQLLYYAAAAQHSLSEFLQRRLMLPNFRLAGTPDGLIEWQDRSETVLEVKSHGASYNYDNGPSEIHVRQTELNIELFHETTAHRPEEGIIIYGHAEDYGRLALHRVERRPAVFIEMLGKVAAAFEARSAAEVTAEGVVTKQCVICPYRSRCVAAQMHAIPAAGTGGLDQATLRTIDRLIAARARAVDAEEEAAHARAEVEAEIIATLTNGGASRIKRNGYAVQLKTPADGFAVLEIRSA
jgi:hypothetical protein